MSGISSAVEALRRSIEIFDNQVLAASPSSLLKPNSKLLRKLRPEPGSLGDGAARAEAGTALIGALVDLYPKLRRIGKPRFFLVTFCYDQGMLKLDAKDAPQLEPMKHKIYKAVASMGLDAIGVMEVAPFRKSKLHDKMLFLHGHLVGWTFDPAFKPNKAADFLMKGPAFPNSLGLPSVTIRSRRKSANVFQGEEVLAKRLFSDLEEDQTDASLAWLGYYLFQAPSYAQHAYRDKKRPGKVKLRKSKNQSHSLAIASRRLLNKIPVGEAIFGIGEGRLVRLDWKRRYLQAMKAHERTLQASRAETRRRRKAKKLIIKRRQAKLAKRMVCLGEVS